jgi:hypothetical protein
LDIRIIKDVEEMQTEFILQKKKKKYYKNSKTNSVELSSMFHDMSATIRYIMILVYHMLETR